LARDALLTMLHPLLENVKFLASEFHFHGWKSPEIAWGEIWTAWLNIEFNSDLAPCNFWAFPTMKRELRGKKFQSNQWSAACFLEVGGAL
jgi:hypothetical protein